MITWSLKYFHDLSADELYNFLDLRNRIFVVEQNCIYQDTDSKDKKAYHLFAATEQQTVAYARLLAPRLSYPEASIGRVCCDERFRQLGLGKELMLRAIGGCRTLFGTAAIRISAQLYLKGFYENLGFVAKGEKYLEDGIEHIEMLLQ